jgi:hypothetical protein
VDVYLVLSHLQIHGHNSYDWNTYSLHEQWLLKYWVLTDLALILIKDKHMWSINGYIFGMTSMHQGGQHGGSECQKGKWMDVDKKTSTGIVWEHGKYWSCTGIIWSPRTSLVYFESVLQSIIGHRNGRHRDVWVKELHMRCQVSKQTKQVQTSAAIVD